MNFKKWFNESVVEFNNIVEAIKKTLQFVNDEGQWAFEPQYHGVSGLKTKGTAGWYHTNKGSFFVSVHVVLKDQTTYNPLNGVDNNQNKLEFISSVLVKNPYTKKLQKIGEKSNVKEPIIRTPYELANWFKQVVDNWSNNDGDDDDDVYDPTPAPSSNQLVGV